MTTAQIQQAYTALDTWLKRRGVNMGDAELEAITNYLLKRVWNVAVNNCIDSINASGLTAAQKTAVINIITGTQETPAT